MIRPPHLLFPALLLLVACGDDATTGAGGGTTAVTSTTGGVVTGAGGATCGPTPGLPADDACKACTAQHCCDQGQACAADPTCDAIATCAESCGADEACIVTNCVPLEPMGPLPSFMELTRCQLDSCQPECNLHVVCGALGPPNDPECGACLATECCDEAQASYSVDSLDFALCQLACLDWPCVHDCELAHPDAVAAQTANLQCNFGPPCVDACTGTVDCGLTTPNPTCNTCLVETCCAEVTAVLQSTESLDYLTCRTSCQGPGECPVECATLWSAEDAAPSLVALNCLQDRCTTACGAAGSGCGQSDLLDSPACSACIRASCCPEGTACGADAACMALEVCIALCDGDAACRATCETDHAAGLTLYQPLDTCITASCEADCP